VIQEGSKPAKFCVGRLHRDIPIGLIVYAGRNQANHIDERLREPNITIFEKLCLVESFSDKGSWYRDPAFDLENDRIVNYACNITAILEWRNNESYFEDMRRMAR
jgi:hypothetical protein